MARYSKAKVISEAQNLAEEIRQATGYGVEVVDDPKVEKESDGGAWVAAWIYVSPQWD